MRFYIVHYELHLDLDFHLHVHFDLASIIMCANACKNLCACCSAQGMCSMSSSYVCVPTVIPPTQPTSDVHLANAAVTRGAHGPGGFP